MESWSPPGYVFDIQRAKDSWIVEEDDLRRAKADVRRIKAAMFGLSLVSVLPLPSSLKQRFDRKWSLEVWHEKLQTAQENLSWARYDLFFPKRPLHPRKRALSSSNLRFQPSLQECSEQLQSIFFRSPGEVRNEIYKRYLAGLLTELILSPPGKGGPEGSKNRTVLLKSFADDQAVDLYQVGFYDPFVLNWVHWMGASVESRGRSRNILSLLQTCRKIYDEALPILYHESTFRVITTSDCRLSPVRGLMDYLPETSRFKHISSLQIHVNLGLAGFQERLGPVRSLPCLERLMIRAYHWPRECCRNSAKETWKVAIPVLKEIGEKVKLVVVWRDRGLKEQGGGDGLGEGKGDGAGEEDVGKCVVRDDWEAMNLYNDSPGMPPCCEEIAVILRMMDMNRDFQ